MAMDSTWPKKAADSFWLAAARSMEERRINPEQVQLLLIPGVVCMAFSIELGIKAILLTTTKPPKTHDLAKLFVLLPQSVQDEIVVRCQKARPDFDASLNAVAKVFEDWRYVYEMPTINLDIGFLQSFADAVRASTEKYAR